MVGERTKQNSQQRAFTLIELLTVIVIIGIIIGIGIPVMNNITRSAGLGGAIRQVSNTAQLARQFAITHRVRTELRVTNTYNAISVFTNGVQLDKWTYLPVGVAIMPAPASDISLIFKATGDLASPINQRIVIREGFYDTNSSKILATNSNVGTITVDALLGRVTVQTPQ